MPLNIENKQYVSIEEETAPKPILHKPGKQYGSLRYFLLGVFIIAVTTSSLFLLYIFYLNIYMPTGITESEFEKPQPQVTQIPESVPAETTIAPQAEPIEISPPAKTSPATEPRYTIYIGAYSAEKPASEEVKRWNEAGFISAVVHGKSNFKVSIGRFQTESEAKEFAGQWSDAFEYGFWIGTFE